MTTFNAAVEQPTLSFPDASSLDLLIPDSPDFDVEACLKSNSQLRTRNVLLFGMCIELQLDGRQCIDS
jgi:hypothetical protein